MHLAKHVAAVWSSEPGPNTAPPDPAGIQADVAACQPRREVLTTWSGPATVCAYTVAHGRDGAPQQGLVVLDTAAAAPWPASHDADCSPTPSPANSSGRPCR